MKNERGLELESVWTIHVGGPLSSLFSPEPPNFDLRPYNPTELYLVYLLLMDSLSD